MARSTPLSSLRVELASNRCHGWAAALNSISAAPCDHAPGQARWGQREQRGEGGSNRGRIVHECDGPNAGVAGVALRRAIR
jgi:hypothetical protein